jgi:2-desacetyl-2-hydroxyethyl bacteriochlorophyllide A dehydrogenase
MKAKRLVFPSEFKVEVQEFDLADELKPDEVLLENVHSLISPGTELAMFTKTHVGFANPANKYAKYPFKAGYCAAGRAIKIGAEAAAQGVKEGELFMHRGNHASHHIANIHPDPWSMFERVPAGVAPQHAMFCVLAEISLTSVLLSHIEAGQNVAVFGQGLIGNFAAQLMRTCGAKRVAVLDPVPERLKTSARCGLKLQVNPTDAEWKKKLTDLVGSHGCHIVVEATGNPNVAIQALQASAPFGKVILLGSPRGSATIDLYNQIHSPGIQLIGAHGNHLNSVRYFNSHTPAQIVLEFIADGRLTVEPLITHTLPASQAETAYQGLLKKPAEYLGIILDLKKW